MFGSSLADHNSVFDIAVAAAVAVALCVKRIVPNPDTDVINAVFAENLVDALFHALMVVVLHAACSQCRHTGGIHAENKLFRQIFHLFDVQGIGGHRSDSRCVRMDGIALLRAIRIVAGAASRQQQAHQQK